MESTPTTGAIIKEVTLNAPIATVWKAITDRDEMKQWYFELEEFVPQVGFEFEFLGGDEKQYMHLCRVIEAEPNKKLTYNWRYEGYPGESFVTFELFGEGDKTHLKLTHAGLETFPADNPDFAKRNFVAGWEDIIGKSLPEYLGSG
jgi:uncharacterized protein YndB with AHSA1/START domain